MFRQRDFWKRQKFPPYIGVHAVPDEDKITALRQFLGELGLQLGGGKKPGPKDFQRTMNL